MDTEATLIIASSERDADLYYATRFLAPDPFVFLEVDGQKILVMSDLELDRAKSQARVDRVLAASRYREALKARGVPHPETLDVVDAVLAELGIRKLLVPATFPVAYADGLRKRGYSLRFKKEPFFEQRTVKTPEELAAITESLRAAEAVLGEALEVIRRAEIRGGILYADGEPLTSQRLKRFIETALLQRGCTAQHTIVASGEQACDPHHEGDGPLLADRSIILDIFPCSTATRYYADITRTVIRGKAPPQLRAMYQAVREAQEVAFGLIREGAVGQEVHRAVADFLKGKGYETGTKDGRMQGFFHGTGHGLGLEVHEPPRIGPGATAPLQAGNVVTVEPGLYYPGTGAVRLEDLVVVEKNGCRNLTAFPKDLEL